MTATLSYSYIFLVLALIGHCDVEGSLLKIEAENMDNVNSTAVHGRSNASKEKSVVMFTGETIFFDLCLMSATNVTVKSLTYSNDGESDLLEVAVDSNISVWNLETKSVPGGGSGWNQFVTAASNSLPLLMTEGRHRLTIEILSSDPYGIEIDYIVIEADARQNVDTLKCSVFCFEDITYVDDMPYQTTTTTRARAIQKSEPTQCAEEDNINIPVFHESASKFVVSASIPKYATFLNNRGPDWLNCEMMDAFWMFRNLNLGTNVTNYRNGAAVLNVTVVRGYLMNEHRVTVDVKFDLKGPMVGSTDSEIGALFNISEISFNGNIKIDFWYFGRAKVWSKVQSQIFTGNSKNAVFETPDFSFLEGSDNKMRMTFITTRQTDDIVIKSLYMFKRKLKKDASTTIFKDGTTVIEGMDIDMWWRLNETMSVSVASSTKSYNNVDYIRIYQQVPWSDHTYSQVFVLYQDGNVRLLPLTPHGLDWIPFGSSVLIGQSDPSSHRPCAPISHLDIDPHTLTIKIFYYDGGFTSMQLRTTLHQTELMVQESSTTLDPARFPFFTFRSMWITDGNADVDHVTVDGTETHKILDNWGTLRGNFFAFYRKCISKHNTLSPDIRLKVLS